MNLQRVDNCLKSANAYCWPPKYALSVASLWCGNFKKVVEQAELAHDVEGRGMDGVAAKVAQEVGMLLEHDDVDAGARQQEAEHELRTGRRRQHSNGSKFVRLPFLALSDRRNGEIVDTRRASTAPR